MQKIRIAINILFVLVLTVYLSSDVYSIANSEKGITRIEFAKLINKTFGFTGKTETNFGDIKAGYVFEDEVKKAVAAGYMLGYGNRTFRPESMLNRQEAATIAYRLMRLDMDSNTQNNMLINDLENNSELSRKIINSVIDASYMRTYGNSFEPSKTLTSSEAENLIKMLSGFVIDKEGTYIHETVRQTEGNVTISTAGVKLINETIKGSLFITSGAGNGTIELENVKVLGMTIICGGSDVSISKKSALRSVIIDNKNGKTLNLSALSDSRTGNIAINSSSFLNEEDVTGLAFGEININPGLKQGEEVVLKGDFTIVSANAAGLILNIKEETMIGTINLNESTRVKGFGTIGTININSEGCSIEQVPGRVNIMEK